MISYLQKKYISDQIPSEKINFESVIIRKSEIMMSYLHKKMELGSVNFRKNIFRTKYFQKK